jgi:uncharacterized protein YbcI
LKDTGTPARGELLVMLSNEIVGLYKELYGKGPVKARTWYLDGVVLCVLRGGLTRSEMAFVEMGRGDRVLVQRASFHEAVSPLFAQAVEEVTGRHVESTMYACDENNDVSTLVFMLGGREVAAAHDTDEGPARERTQMQRKAAEVARGQTANGPPDAERFP